MDVASLRWFQLVADGVTVTEVSEIEMVSQPAVSRALGRLEQEVGAPLLRREGRVLRMTHAGTVFKRHVDGVLHQLDDGLAAVHQLLDPETGTVTVAFQPSLGTWLVPDLVTSFRAEHPDVRLDLRSKEDETLAAVGAHSAVDLELSTLRPHPGEELVHRERLGHVVVGADVQRLDLVVAAVPRREHDHRRGAELAQPGEHGRAVQVRQAERLPKALRPLQPALPAAVLRHGMKMTPLPCREDQRFEPFPR